MGLASRFNAGSQPSAPSAPSTPQQPPPAAGNQYGGFPAIQQSWQQPAQQQYAPQQQGYQPGPGYQPGYQYSQQGSQPQQQSWQQSQGYQPSGQQGQPQMQAGAGGSGPNDPGIITVINNQLNNIIKVNRLEAFYPPQKLQQVQQHAATVDFRCNDFSVAMLTSASAQNCSCICYTQIPVLLPSIAHKAATADPIWNAAFLFSSMQCSALPRDYSLHTT